MENEVLRIGEIVGEGEVENEEQIDMPPGFRFHPTDEELISHYLKPKVLNSFFSSVAIGEVDLNKVEPWDLPWKAKIGEKEWYFFCIRDRKYPTGLRTNRATKAGYWKATGKDKEICKGKSLVGMKKTLVFYKGRAPKGVKTNWVMHEFRLDGKYAIHNLPKTAKNEWVISRVFHKRADGKKVDISGLMKLGSEVNQFQPVGLPSLMEGGGGSDGGSLSHVTCFSEDKSLLAESKDDINLAMFGSSSTSQLIPNMSSLLYTDPDSSILKMLLDSEESQFRTNHQSSDALENVLTRNSIHGHGHGHSGPVELDCFWNF